MIAPDELRSVTARVEDLVDAAQGDAVRCSGLMLLAKLYALDNRAGQAQRVLREVVETSFSTSVTHRAQEAQRRIHEQFGQWDEAVRVSAALVDELTAEVDAAGDRESGDSMLWWSEVQWLGGYYARVGRYLDAAAVYRRVTDRELEPRLRWAMLFEQARLYDKAQLPEQAAELYREASEAIAAMPPFPRQAMFLATEVEIVRGSHGEVSRAYLEAARETVARYEACGACTLPFKYTLAVETLLELADLTDAERREATTTLESIIRDAEAHRGEASLGIDDDMLRTAYITAIEALTDAAAPPDERALELLAMLQDSMGGEPTVAGFLARIVQRVSPQFAEEAWAEYPRLDALRAGVSEADEAPREGTPGAARASVDDAAPASASDGRDDESVRTSPTAEPSPSAAPVAPRADRSGRVAPPAAPTEAATPLPFESRRDPAVGSSADAPRRSSPPAAPEEGEAQVGKLPTGAAPVGKLASDAAPRGASASRMLYWGGGGLVFVVMLGWLWSRYHRGV